MYPSGRVPSPMAGTMYHRTPVLSYANGEPAEGGRNAHTSRKAQIKLKRMAAVGPPHGENPALLVHILPWLHLRYKSPVETKSPTRRKRVYVYSETRIV